MNWSNAQTTAQTYGQLPDGVSVAFTDYNGGYGSYGSVLNVKAYPGSGGGTLQLYIPYADVYGGTGLKYRKFNYAGDWGSLRTLWDSGNLSPVTTDTAQTITGAKTFTDKIIAGTGKGFRNAGYHAGFNPIWSLGNAETYGLGYYQGAHGLAGVTGDAIGFHFGSTAAPKVIIDTGGKVIATTFIGALTGNASSAAKLQTARTIWGQSFDGTGNVSGAITGATTGNFSGTLRLTKDTPSGTTYGALAMEVYSTGGHPVGIGFHRGGYTQTILAHESSGLVVRTSTISTGALAPITASSFIGALSGNASTATALTTDAGSATQPVYFSGGKPVATTYSLGTSVPSNAVFTDTNTH